MRTANTKALSGIVTANDVANMDYVLMSLGPYEKYFGKPATNVKMMVHGQPGAGKTYFLLKFANWFAKNIGSVLYVAAEEYGSPTLAEKLKAIKQPFSPNLHFSPDVNGLNNYEYDLVIFDSIQAAKLDLDMFKELVKRYPLSAFILVLQKTKDGNFKGSKEWEHEIDIASEVKFNDDGERVIHTYKNRYQVIGENKI